MGSETKNAAEYLARLSPDQRGEIEAVRDALRRIMPPGYEEGMQYGMIGWYVPHTTFPDGYHCNPSEPLPFAGLGAQKRHLALYLMGLAIAPEVSAALEADWRASGQKLDMGKACIRFQRAADLPMPVIAKALAALPVATYVSRYVASRPASATRTTRKAAAPSASNRSTAGQLESAPQRTAPRASKTLTSAAKQPSNATPATKAQPAKKAVKKAAKKAVKKAGDRRAGED